MLPAASLQRNFKFTLSVLVYLITVIDSQETPTCDPPVVGCSCLNDTITCSNITEFPIFKDQDKYSKYKFVNCTIPDIITVPYVTASSLEIVSCGVQKIKDSAFANLTNLEILVIKDIPLENGLTDNTLAGLVNLKKLKLVKLGLTTLPSSMLEKMKSLEALDLSMNPLEFTEGLLSGASSSLKIFTCTSCGLESFPKDTLKNLPGLTQLCLMNNSLQSLPESAFSQWPTMKVLCMSRCGIKDIDKDALKGLNSLVTLNLRYNLITNLDSDMFKPLNKTLQKLMLAGNMLETLSEDLLNWSSLEKLSLGNNPLKCDCSAAWMLSGKLQNVTKDNITCSSPVTLQGRFLFDLNNDVMCDSGQSSVVLGITITILLICLLVLFLYCVKKRFGRKGNRSRELNAVKYHSVYGETVETNSRQNILS